MTRQFFRYASRAYGGRRDINAKDLGWYIPRKKIDPVGLLDSLLINKGKNLSQYEPLNRQYNLLKDYLLKYYKAKKMEPGKPLLQIKKVISRGILRLPSLKIKKRLLFTGTWRSNDTSAFFTDSMVTAIKRYQHRNGLTEDGIAGASLSKR